MRKWRVSIVLQRSLGTTCADASGNAVKDAARDAIRNPARQAAPAEVRRDIA